MALVDQYGRPIKISELTREHAAPTLAGVRTIWDSSVASGLTPVRLANLLRDAAAGDTDAYLTLAEEIEERDLHYAAELSKRKLAVSRLPISVESADDTSTAVEQADAVRALVRKPGFRMLLKDLLDGLGKGFAVVEIDWNRAGSRWLPQRYQWRDPHFFMFDRIARQEIRLRDDADSYNGLPLAPFKFIRHVPKIKSGIPIRGGLARLAAWAYMCKGYTVKDWLAFAEVFGMPLRMGKYKPGASEDDIAILKRAVANLGSDAGAVFPESMLIELVEAGGKTGSSDFFDKLAGYLDNQISKGVLGQTASSSGTPGKLGDEKLQSDVRDDIRDDDAEQLADTLNLDLVRPFIDLNFGPQDEYPTITLAQPDSEDTAALVDAVTKLVPLGLRVEQSVLCDKLGLPDAKGAKPEDLLTAPAGQISDFKSEMSDPEGRSLNRKERNASRQADSAAPGQQALDALADQLSSEAAALLEKHEQQIMQAIQAADSFEEAMESVLQLWPELDMADIQTLMERGWLAATLGGMQAEQDGSL